MNLNYICVLYVSLTHTLYRGDIYKRNQSNIYNFSCCLHFCNITQKAGDHKGQFWTFKHFICASEQNENVFLVSRLRLCSHWSSIIIFHGFTLYRSSSLSSMIVHNSTYTVVNLKGWYFKFLIYFMIIYCKRMYVL